MFWIAILFFIFVIYCSRYKLQDRFIVEQTNSNNPRILSSWRRLMVSLPMPLLLQPLPLLQHPPCLLDSLESSMVAQPATIRRLPPRAPTQWEGPRPPSLAPDVDTAAPQLRQVSAATRDHREDVCMGCPCQ